MVASCHVYSADMILITGGAGFIGSNLQAALSRRGHETVVVDTLGSDGKWRNLANHPPTRIVSSGWPGRLPRRPSSLGDGIPPRSGQRNDRPDGDHTWATNVELSRRSVGMVRRSQARLVYASSAATYGDGGPGFPGRISLAALSGCGRSTSMAGPSMRSTPGCAKVLTVHRNGHHNGTGLKFFNVYGPNEYHKGRHDLRREGQV